MLKVMKKGLFCKRNELLLYSPLWQNEKYFNLQMQDIVKITSLTLKLLVLSKKALHHLNNIYYPLSWNTLAEICFSYKRKSMLWCILFSVVGDSTWEDIHSFKKSSYWTLSVFRIPVAMQPKPLHRVH